MTSQNKRTEQTPYCDKNDVHLCHPLNGNIYMILIYATRNATHMQIVIPIQFNPLHSSLWSNASGTLNINSVAYSSTRCLIEMSTAQLPTIQKKIEG